MRMDKLTSKLQLALADAQSLAVGKDHNQIAPVHLISALVNQKGGSIKPLLMQTGFDVQKVQKGLLSIVDDLPVVSDSDGDVNLSQELAKLLNIADKISQQNNDQFIYSDSVLLAAMQDKSELGKLLNSFSVSKQALENSIKNLRGGEGVDDPEAEGSNQALQKYTVDVTAKAEEGKLDPIVGREKEIERVSQILSRRKKNNPILLGEPGVGKSAIAEGLALRIVQKKVSRV